MQLKIESETLTSIFSVPRSDLFKTKIAFLISENEYLTIAKVGNGFTDEQRDSIFNDLEKQKVDSDYVEVSSSNIAFTMVKPVKVMEFSCLDVYNENSKGTIKKMSLTFENSGYSAVYKKPSIIILLLLPSPGPNSIISISVLLIILGKLNLLLCNISISFLVG